VNLDGAALADDTRAVKPYTFRLTVPGRTYWLCVDDRKDFQDWCEAFEFVAGTASTHAPTHPHTHTHTHTLAQAQSEASMHRRTHERRHTVLSGCGGGRHRHPRDQPGG
jgi:hypothetical protein